MKEKNRNLKLVKVLLMSASLLCCSGLFGQEDKTETSLAEVSIFTTLNDFNQKKSNSKDSFLLKYEHKDFGYGWLKEKAKIRWCDFDVPKKTRRKKLSKIFAFFDGKDYYINPSYPFRLNIKEHFARLEGKGRFLYYVKYNPLEYSLFATGTSGMKGHNVQEMIFDTKTNTKVELTKMSLRKVLKRDKELLEQFNKESKKGKKLKKYFLDYCERNPD